MEKHNTEQMNNSKTLRIAEVSLKEAIALFGKGVYVDSITLDSFSNDILASLDANTREQFLTYYTPNLETGSLDLDMSIPEQADEKIFSSIERREENGEEYNTYNISNISSDDMGYNIRTDNGQVINCDSNMLFESEEQYSEARESFLNRAKDVTKNTAKSIGSALAAPAARYVVMKANRVKNVDELLEGGLYHFTSDKCADLIMKSGYIKASGRATSYSRKKKTFFFGENASMQDVMYNCRELKKEMTAIHVKYNEALQRDVMDGKVHVRLDDGAICIVGDTKKEYGYEMEKVKMELVKDKDRFYYKNVNERNLTDQEIQNSGNVDKELKKYAKMPKFVRELVTYPNLAKNAVSRFAKNIKEYSETKALPEARIIQNIKTENNPNILDTLRNETYKPEIAGNNMQEIQGGLNERNREYEEF